MGKKAFLTTEKWAQVIILNNLKFLVRQIAKDSKTGLRNAFYLLKFKHECTCLNLINPKLTLP